MGDDEPGLALAEGVEMADLTMAVHTPGGAWRCSDDFNGLDPAITLATLPAFARVAPRQMVATVKIIPYAVAGPPFAAALSLAI